VSRCENCTLQRARTLRVVAIAREWRDMAKSSAGSVAALGEMVDAANAMSRIAIEQVKAATARAEQAERERDKACAMYCDLFPVHSAAWHLLTSEQRALVESWLDAAKKGNGT
jgi:hypothetical protein